jgi:hypothetical protein
MPVQLFSNSLQCCQGGAIYVYQGATCNIDGGTFLSNIAEDVSQQRKKPSLTSPWKTLARESCRAPLPHRSAPFRTASAPLLHRFRTASAPLPHRFRTASAPLPHRFRTASAPLPRNYVLPPEPELIVGAKTLSSTEEPSTSTLVQIATSTAVPSCPTTRAW